MHMTECSEREWHNFQIVDNKRMEEVQLVTKLVTCNDTGKQKRKPKVMMRRYSTLNPSSLIAVVVFVF